jgi:hypothetical protein
VGAGISVPAGWNIQDRGQPRDSAEDSPKPGSTKEMRIQWRWVGERELERRMLILTIRRPCPKLAKWRPHDSLCGTPLSLSSEAGPGE